MLQTTDGQTTLRKMCRNMLNHFNYKEQFRLWEQFCVLYVFLQCCAANRGPRPPPVRWARAAGSHSLVAGVDATARRRDGTATGRRLPRGVTTCRRHCSHSSSTSMSTDAAAQTRTMDWGVHGRASKECCDDAMVPCSFANPSVGRDWSEMQSAHRRSSKRKSSHRGICADSSSVCSCRCRWRRRSVVDDIIGQSWVITFSSFSSAVCICS